MHKMPISVILFLINYEGVKAYQIGSVNVRDQGVSFFWELVSVLVIRVHSDRDPRCYGDAGVHYVHNSSWPWSTHMKGHLLILTLPITESIECSNRQVTNLQMHTGNVWAGRDFYKIFISHQQLTCGYECLYVIYLQKVQDKLPLQGGRYLSQSPKYKINAPMKVRKWPHFTNGSSGIWVL